MRLCLSLARKGEGEVSPNPMVGAVVVKDGSVIAKGYHRRFGGPHAEVYALRNLRGDLRRATLYVNLEPCNYHGKTPPCTELIIRSGIRNVVVGMTDPNPRVAGGGIRALRRAGVRVRAGVLDEQCREFNRAFIKRMTAGMPYVTAKVAQTLDGYIADSRGRSRWISGEESRRFVQALRATHDAILVGAETVRKDDPRLTVREGPERRPLRVVIDGNLSSPPGAKVFRNQSSIPTIVFCGAKAAKKFHSRKARLERQGVAVYPFPVNASGRIDAKKILRLLSRLGIGSVLVEGGSDIFGQFLDQRLIDRLYCFIAPKILGGGVPAFRMAVPATVDSARRMDMKSIRDSGGDMLIEAGLA